MKRKLSAIILLVLLAALGAGVHRRVVREERFLQNAFRQLEGGGGTEPRDDIALESGASVSVILEHGCCSGAGFDAVAVRTSDGQEFFAKKNYCGLQGFRMSLSDDSTKDLARFTAFLRNQGYETK